MSRSVAAELQAVPQEVASDLIEVVDIKKSGMSTRYECAF